MKKNIFKSIMDTFRAEPKNTAANHTSIENQIFSPASVALRDPSSMSSGYTGKQFDNDVRVLRESIKLIESTDNLEIFFSRHELAMQKIAMLEMAKQAGMAATLPTSIQEVTKLRKRAEHVLTLSYQKELDAINNTKAMPAKIKKINSFIDHIKLYESELRSFESYDRILNELDALKEKLNVKK